MNNSFNYTVHKRQIIGSIIAISVIFIAAIFLYNIHSFNHPYGAPWDIGSAAFFPGLIALLLVILGVFILIEQWKKNETRTAYMQVEKNNNIKIITTYTLISAIILTLPLLGIWLTAMIIVPALALCFGENRWKRLLLLCVLPPFIIIHLFENVMGIYFPTGVFF
jgi:NADH:ubiquinone oxidoreductase subunit 6 (subunit J)